MPAILEEPRVERKPGTFAAACEGVDMKEAAERLERRFQKAKTAFCDKLEDGKMAAERIVKHGCYAAEDNFEEAIHKVKREPVKFMAMAFAAGALVGFVLPRFGRRHG